MPDEYHFPGFSKPTYTQVPDQLFDDLLPRLSESELKVLLYVVRRTFGFKKDADSISLKQMVEGILTRDGRQLDAGTGLSRPSVSKGVKGLVEKGILTATRNSSKERGDEPTTYSLRFADPVETFLRGGSQDSYEGGGNDLTRPPRNDFSPQQTVEQHTVLQETDSSNHSNGHSIMTTENDEHVAWMVQDFAREFADKAPLRSSLTRALRLYHQSELDLDDFLDLMQAARVRTKRYSGNVKTAVGSDGRKPKMAYFFGVLESLIGDNSSSPEP